MSDLKSVMTEWIELKKHITQARKDLSVLSKREKELSEFIKQSMVKNDVEDVKILTARYNTIKIIITFRIL